MENIKKKGEIIAVVGAPASGKSFLINEWKKKYDITAFFEGEEKDLPKYIKSNIRLSENGLQTTLYFHNQAVRHYLKALKLKNEEKSVILDTFWLSSLFYLDIVLTNKNEKGLVNDLIQLTLDIFSMPDKIVFLDVSNKTLKERILKRGREFEKNFLNKALKISKAHKEYFAIHKTNLNKIEADVLDPNLLAKALELHEKC